MSALVPLPVWVPEDDFLLKNAVEAGASLESLAKGAVRFSRKYNIREVQDRWHSLLYDPIISAEACDRMIVFGQTNPSKSIKENSGSSKKRKSVRSCYYALRKRIHNEPFDPLGTHFLIAPGQSSFARDDNCMLQDPISSHFELKDSDMEIVKSVFPQIVIEDPAPCVDTGPSQKINDESIGACFSILPVEQNNLRFVGQGNLCQGTKASPTGHNCRLGGDTCNDSELANSLNSSTTEPLHTFDSSPAPVMPIWKSVEEVPMPVMPLDMTLEGKDVCGGNMFALDDDIAAKDSGNSGCYTSVPVDELKGLAVNTEIYLEGLSKSLLDLTKDREMLFQDDLGKDLPDKSYNDGLSSLLSIPDDATPDEPPNPTDLLTSANPKVDPSSTQILNSLDVTGVDPELPVAPISDPKFPEAADDVWCCILSTEDPDIPSNDDFIPKKSTSAAPSSMQRKAANNVLIALGNEFSVNQRTVERGPRSILRETTGQMFTSSQNLGPQRSPGMYCNQPVGCYDLKNELSDVKSLLKSDSNEGHVLSTIQDHQVSDTEVGVIDLAEMEQLMGVNSAESEEIESDDDVPYFSDIEAMVLDLDLDPDDQESNAHAKVLRYQSEEAKRAIVRLEQGAHSYMRRDIASHGAIAVLYGRHSKHYIKKHEVLLGRSTEGFSVDIDLGREGHNKISRRQAIIKLEKDGYFLLKNLGKCGILVNNKEVSPGHSLRLCSNSLMEVPSQRSLIAVRGMPFIFETNDARIKRYLEGFAGK